MMFCFSIAENSFFGMTAVAQPLFERIQRPNESVLAGVDGSVVASHAVSIMQALPVGAVARQCGGVSARHQQDQQRYTQNAFHGSPPTFGQLCHMLATNAEAESLYY